MSSQWPLSFWLQHMMGEHFHAGDLAEHKDITSVSFAYSSYDAQSHMFK
jgi:hypothetical protein